MKTLEELKAAACASIESHKEGLNQLSRDIWEHPELAHEEHHAHKVLTEYLVKAGFTNVTPHYLLPTGFKAEYGEGSPHVAVLCEYDALPGIGHACGHNLIAEAGIAAGIGIKAAMEASGKAMGKLTVLGTPAEEGFGGKVEMAEKGAFKDVDLAMMVHPTTFNSVCGELFLAVDQLDIKYYGKATHASAHPWEGINALDAAVMCYSGISVLRQQLKPTWKVHSVITNGGLKPNIIPEETALEYLVRAPNMKELRELKQKVIKCVEAAAKATGCELKLSSRPYGQYANVINNPTLKKLFIENTMSLGLDGMVDERTMIPRGSTDMGNVSYEVPSIHPMFAIETKRGNHTKEFTVATGDMKAQAPTLLQGKAMAMSAIDAYCQPELVSQMKQELEEKLKFCQ